MFPGADGYALGSIEGRVAIQYVLFISPPLLSFVRRTHYLRFVRRTLILGTSTIKTKSKHTSAIVLLVSSDRHGVGKTIRSDATGKTKRQAGKIKRWCSRSMISSFIQYMGHLPHAVRKMHRPLSLIQLYAHTERSCSLSPSFAPPPLSHYSVTYLWPLVAW